MLSKIDGITTESANFETVLSLVLPVSSFFVPDDEDVYLNWIEKVAENKKTGPKKRVKIVGTGKRCCD